MCLSDVLRLVEVSADGASGIGESGAGRRDVSLLVLTLDGLQPAVGDWVVVTTGLAVEMVTEEEARAVNRSRAAMGQPEQEGSP